MKVLIVKTSSMGDVIHTFPAVQDALAAKPGIRFDWCVEEAFAPIAALHPAIGSIHRVALRRWRKKLLKPETWRESVALRTALRTGNYDLVIDAQGLLKSAFVARLAGAPIAGYDRASIREPSASPFYNRRFAVSRQLHAIERNRRLFGLALGYEPYLSRFDSGIEPPATKTPEPASSTAFLLHGTSREEKKWPVENWIEVARLAVQRGMTPMTTWGNDRERSVAEAIAAAIPQTILIPKSPLGEIADLIGRSSLVVGADTGLTHLAAAFSLPTVAVFVSTLPGLTGPRGAYASTLLTTPEQPLSAQDVMAEGDRLMAEVIVKRTAP